MDKCDLCSGKLTTRRATANKPYRYAESGLDNVYLTGVEVFACARCDVETAAIPQIVGLHSLVAQGILARRTPVTGREFRYLRKQASLGLPELSRRMGIPREAVRDFEESEGANPVSPGIICRFADNHWHLSA